MNNDKKNTGSSYEEQFKTGGSENTGAHENGGYENQFKSSDINGTASEDIGMTASDSDYTDSSSGIEDHYAMKNCHGNGSQLITERKIVSIRDLLYIFFKHLRSIIVITLVALTLSTLYAFTTTPLYTSEIKMLVQIGREKFAELEESNKSVNYNVLFQERRQNINNELQIFKEDNLTKRICPRLKKWLEEHGGQNNIENGIGSLADRIKAFLGYRSLSMDDKLMLKIKNALRVEFMPESDIIRLAFTWDDPEFAAVAVQAYAREFLKVRSEVFQAKKSYQFYLDQIALYQKKLNDITESLRNFTKKWNLTQIDLEKELLLRSKDQLETRQHDYANTLKKLAAYQKTLKEMYENPDAWIETPKLSDNEMIDKQAYLQDLDRQYFAMKLQRDQMLATFTPRAREILELNRNIQKLRERKYNSLQNILDSKIFAMQQVGDTVKQEIKAKEKRLDVLNQASFIFNNLKLREKVVKENLLMYTSKAESLRIFDDRDKRLISSIKIMNKPLPPLLPSYPKKLLIILTTTVLGLFVSFGIAAISEYFSHVFRDEYDVEGILGVPLLISIIKLQPEMIHTDDSRKEIKEEKE